MEYKVIIARSTKELQEMVNLYIAHGWTPIGGVCVVNDRDVNYNTYYQSMTKS